MFAGITAFLNILASLAALLPAIHQTILQLEPSFPNASQGAAKIDAVVQTISGLVTAASAAAPGTPDDHVKAVIAALPAVVGVAVTVKTAADAFNAQQSAPSA